MISAQAHRHPVPVPDTGRDTELSPQPRVLMDHQYYHSWNGHRSIGAKLFRFRLRPNPGKIAGKKKAPGSVFFAGLSVIIAVPGYITACVGGAGLRVRGIAYANNTCRHYIWCRTRPGKKVLPPIHFLWKPVCMGRKFFLGVRS